MATPTPLSDERIEELEELLEDADEYELLDDETFVLRSGEDVLWRVEGVVHGEHHPDATSAAERFAELVDELS
jgi:hypothetical protein